MSKMRTKGIKRERIAHPETECDCCNRTWKAQMRQKQMLLHLCAGCAMELDYARNHKGNADQHIDTMLKRK